MLHDGGYVGGRENRPNGGLMSKFKVGDRVRSSGVDGEFLGVVVDINRGKDWPFGVNYAGDAAGEVDGAFAAEDLTLLPAANDNPAPFKVGDRVRVTGSSDVGGVDGVGTLVRIDLDGDPVVQIDAHAVELFYYWRHLGAVDAAPAIADHTADAPGPGRKDDSGKLRFDLIPPRALARMAVVINGCNRLDISQYEDISSADSAIGELAGWKVTGDIASLACAAAGLFHALDQDDFVLFTRGGMESVTRVLEFGGAKYGEWNWEHVADGERRYYAAALRHIAAHNGGELNDAESGLPHLAHALCCVLFLIHIVEVGK